MTRVFVGLGSNLGDREANLSAAIAWMNNEPAMRVLRVSSFEETPPWGVTDQPAFINAVALIETDVLPLELLDRLKGAEVELGRIPGARWGPRVIDLDILLYGDAIVDHPRLTIPHRQLLRRDFVISGVLEIDPDVVYPGPGVPLRELL